MSELVGYITNGVPYGCGYAIVAVSLVLTYQATGVFNFAFGAQAFASAFIFALLTGNEGLPVWAAFLVAVLIMAPGIGLIFDRFLFRHIANTNTTAKIVSGLALLVGIPVFLPILFGNQNIYVVDSILFNADTVYFRIMGTPVTGIYLSAVVMTVVILVALVVLMRFTALGLRMRGAVESRRLVQLDGVNADGVVAVAWAISSFMAGLAGVLLAPVYGQLQAENYITLMVAAIAAAAWAVLRSLPIAAIVGVLIGVVELILQGYLPSGSVLNTAVLPSFPFIVLVLALLLVPGMQNLEANKDPMASLDPPPPPPTSVVRAPQMNRIIRVAWYLLLAGFIASMLSWIPPTWEVVFNNGLAYSTIFLSVTLVTGMAGQLSLAQATLAGVGAFTAAQLAVHLGLNLFLGGLVGAVIAAAVAVVLAVLSLRLKGLGLALMTLAAALFFDNTVFTQSWVNPGGTGSIGLKSSWVNFGPFNFFSNDGHALFVMSMIILAICVGVVLLVRKGTVGRNLAAMRGSEVGAASVGINLTRQRLTVFALAGAVAGIGGMLYTIPQTNVSPNYFNYQFSFLVVVLVVTTGVSTVEGAIQAGIGFVVVNQLLDLYAPGRLQSLTIVLFAFGALQYSHHPEGILEFQKRKWTLRFQRLFFDRDKGEGDTALPLREAGSPELAQERGQGGLAPAESMAASPGKTGA